MNGKFILTLFENLLIADRKRSHVMLYVILCGKTFIFKSIFGSL